MRRLQSKQNSSKPDEPAAPASKGGLNRRREIKSTQDREISISKDSKTPKDSRDEGPLSPGIKIKKSEIEVIDDGIENSKVGDKEFDVTDNDLGQLDENVKAEEVKHTQASQTSALTLGGRQSLASQQNRNANRDDQQKSDSEAVNKTGPKTPQQEKPDN